MNSGVVSRAASVLLERPTLLAVTGVLVGLYLLRGRRRLPPGPPSLPVVGTLLSLANVRNPFRVFLKWRQKYGDIVTTKVSG